jgi:Maintenance of mitochondrial structure and function
MKYNFGFQDGTPTSKTFEHVPSEIGAEEAEEVGVEHLLRDIKDTTVGTLAQRITGQLLGLRGLHSQVEQIKEYLDQVVIISFSLQLKINVNALLGYCQWSPDQPSNHLPPAGHFQPASRCFSTNLHFIPLCQD